MTDTENVALSIRDAIALGARHHQAGRLAEAEAVYRAVLKAAPDEPAAKHNLGLIALHSGREAEAVALIQASVAARPDNPEFQNSLGAALILSGRPQEAEGPLLRALALRPTYEKAIQSIVAHGSREAARTALTAYLAADPSDAIGAAIQLAAMGAAPPARASDARLLRFYGERAARWGEGNGYRHADLVAEAILAATAPGSAILDAGCGTGLVGKSIRSHAGHLCGVDLSPEMIGRARALDVYDELAAGDLVEFLERDPAAFDGIASAATLIHFGDLAAVLAAAFTALRPGGLLIFTAFPDNQNADGYSAGDLSGRAQAGTFRHGREYLRGVARRSGFRTVRVCQEHVEIDPQTGEWVAGLLLISPRA